MTRIFSFLPMMLPTPESGTAGAQGAGSSSFLMTLLMFVPIILIFYFLVIRPQNKKQKDAQKMLSSLKKNDKVVMIGGERGYIVGVKDDTVILKVDDNVKIEYNKSAVSQVLERKEEPQGEIKE
jgi:preprotein translocase subunit YajC